MKTFKPGLYSALLMSAALLSVAGGISRVMLKTTPSAAAVSESPAVISQGVKEAQFQVTDVRSKDEPRRPWFTPGMWSVIKTDQSVVMCLYSDEQIEKNVKANEVGESTDGMLCLAKRPNDWINMVDLPSRAMYEWDMRGVIDAEFTMRDGRKYNAHYFVKPMRPNETMAEVEAMAEFEDFGRMAANARHIKISTRTIDGIVTQNFQNKMDN